MTRNPTYVRADQILHGFMQSWFDGMKEDGNRAYVGADGSRETLEGFVRTHVRAVPFEHERQVSHDWRAGRALSEVRFGNLPVEGVIERMTHLYEEFAETGFPYDLEVMEAYVKETYEDLSPTQVLSTLAAHGFPVNTYGFGSDGKELHRLPG